MSVYAVIAGGYIAFMLAFGTWDWWRSNRPGKLPDWTPPQDRRLARAREKYASDEIGLEEFERKVAKALKRK